jgi:hypothetical protein
MGHDPGVGNHQHEVNPLQVDNMSLLQITSCHVTPSQLEWLQAPGLRLDTGPSYTGGRVTHFKACPRKRGNQHRVEIKSLQPSPNTQSAPGVEASSVRTFRLLSALHGTVDGVHLPGLHVQKQGLHQGRRLLLSRLHSPSAAVHAAGSHARYETLAVPCQLGACSLLSGRHGTVDGVHLGQRVVSPDVATSQQVACRYVMTITKCKQRCGHQSVRQASMT